MRSLGWTEKQYWSVHESLIDSGLIARGRGKGGTVILVVPETDKDAVHFAASLPRKESEAVFQELEMATAEAAERQETSEKDLYKPALIELKRHWAPRNQLLHCAFEVTASQGRRDTGGNWSRPDIVGVGLRKFEYLPDRVVEVYSFELKAEYDITIKGVLEALAHRESATRSYVVYHTGGRAWDDFPEVQRIEQLASRHGVGVIVASKIDDFNDSWDERVVAPRSSADPESLDRFIKSTLNEDTKSQIRKWF